MLTPWDDHFIHQMGETLEVVENEDPRWFDRAYFGLHDQEGKLFMVLGLGTYPNVRVMDGYACAIYNGVQYNLRVSRRVTLDRAHTQVGPLSFRVEEPLLKWHLELAPNELGLGCSLEFQGSFPPYLVKKIVFSRPEGRPTSFSHFIQLGRYQGSVSIAGKEVAVQGLAGARDRSWGLRAARERMGLHMWIQVQFPLYGLSLMYDESRDHTVSYLDGAVLYPAGEAVPIVGVRHRMEFAENKAEHSAGEVVVTDARGQEIHLRSHRLSRGLYMAGAGYGGWHGIERGPFHLEGEQWDLSDPGLMERLPYTLYDQVAHFEAGGQSAVGIFEAGFSRSPAYRYQPVW